MKTRHFIFGLMLLLGCISCSDDDPQLENQTVEKANIKGQVKLFDEGLTQLGNSDMTVRIDGLDI